jgi:hypothetical protein
MHPAKGIFSTQSIIWDVLLLHSARWSSRSSSLWHETCKLDSNNNDAFQTSIWYLQVSISPTSHKTHRSAYRHPTPSPYIQRNVSLRPVCTACRPDLHLPSNQRPFATCEAIKIQNHLLVCYCQCQTASGHWWRSATPAGKHCLEPWRVAIARRKKAAHLQ